MTSDALFSKFVVCRIELQKLECKCFKELKILDRSAKCIYNPFDRSLKSLYLHNKGQMILGIQERSQLIIPMTVDFLLNFSLIGQSNSLHYLKLFVSNFYYLPHEHDQLMLAGVVFAVSVNLLQVQVGLLLLFKLEGNFRDFIKHSE